MIRRLAPVALAVLCLSGCGGAAPQGAAENASRLLAAALKNDRVAFEAEIDRTAVRDDVRRQLADMARTKALDVEGGPSEFALDRMIGPDAMRVVDGAGRSLTVAPTAAEIMRLMSMREAGHACLSDAAEPGRCQLTFAKANGGWRLVGMQATGLRIRVAER